MDGPLCGSRRGGHDGLATYCVVDLADRDWRRAPDQEVTTKADTLVDRGADRLGALADKAADKDGVAAKLAEPLAEDAAFLRKLKPSLMVARAKGEAPTNEQPGEARRAPGAPQLGKRPDGKSGPNPYLVIGVAFAAGFVLAKWIDWRGHAHPRD